MSIEEQVWKFLKTPVTRREVFRESANTGVTASLALSLGEADAKALADFAAATSSPLAASAPIIEGVMPYPLRVNSVLCSVDPLDGLLQKGGVNRIPWSYLPSTGTPLERSRMSKFSTDELIAMIQQSIPEAKNYFRNRAAQLKADFPNPTEMEIADAIEEIKHAFGDLSSPTKRRLTQCLRENGDLTGVYDEMAKKVSTIVADQNFRPIVEKFRGEVVTQHEADPAMLPDSALVKIVPSTIERANPYARIDASRNSTNVDALLIHQPNYEIFLPRARMTENKEEWQARTKAMVDGIKAYLTADEGPFRLNYIKSANITDDGRVLLTPNHDGEKSGESSGCFQTFLDMLNERAAETSAKLQAAGAGR